MRKCEDEAIQNKRLSEGQRLSRRMRDSWKSGDFWIMYAARNNFAFDAIYWKKIDRRFFGSATCEDVDISSVWRKRVHLLEPEEMGFMEECVDMKLKERSAGLFAWDPNEYTVGWIKRSKVIRKIKEIKENMERVVLEWDEEINRMLEMERKGKIKKMNVINRIKGVKEEMEEMKRKKTMEWEKIELLS